jgi:DNA-binding CsgD family transcriptional regulator
MSPSAVVALPRPSGRYPLLVSIVPLFSIAKLTRDYGGELKLLLINDPSPGTRSASEGLQLLGLTPAESKAATLVGSGMSPKEAALALGNTEATLRFTLKQVYSKLNIARQSELAGLVTRVGSVLE